MDKSHKFAALIFTLLFFILLIPFVTFSGASVSELRVESSYNYVGWIVVGAIALIVILVVFIRFKPIDFKSGKGLKHLYQPKSKKEEIMDYIEYKLSVGENRLSIREELLSVGWSEHLVNDAFREVEHYSKKKK